MNDIKSEAPQRKRDRHEYMKQYYADHREQINEKRRAWRKANPEIEARYKAKYWARKLEEAQQAQTQN